MRVLELGRNRNGVLGGSWDAKGAREGLLLAETGSVDVSRRFSCRPLHARSVTHAFPLEDFPTPEIASVELVECSLARTTRRQSSGQRTSTTALTTTGCATILRIQIVSMRRTSMHQDARGWRIPNSARRRCEVGAARRQAGDHSREKALRDQVRHFVTDEALIRR